MNKNKILADIILGIHLILVFIILFGWYFPTLKYIYLSSLIGTLVSEAALGCCIFTKWEFDFRQKADPNLKFDYFFLSYYAYKFFGSRINEKYIRYLALIFLLTSIILWLIMNL